MLMGIKCRNVICKNKNKKGGKGRVVQEQSFHMSLSWYQVKVDYYKFRTLMEISVATTKKISKTHTHKELRKESKYYTMKTQLTQKNVVLEEMRNKKGLRHSKNRQQKG
jgi:hypothetical protein